MSSYLSNVCDGSPSGDKGRETPETEVQRGRSSGKGRRRRAAAEQRRIEQQRWGEVLSEEDNPSPPAPTPSTRRARRALRRQTRLDSSDDFEELSYNSSSNLPIPREENVEDLELALALSLSLSEGIPENMTSSIGTNLELSYENLVDLENVNVCTPKDFVDTLAVAVYGGKEDPELSELICPICQCEIVEGDLLIFLPCCHSMHNDCGKEWLLNYSKCCPVCKSRICE